MHISNLATCTANYLTAQDPHEHKLNNIAITKQEYRSLTLLASSDSMYVTLSIFRQEHVFETP